MPLVRGYLPQFPSVVLEEDPEHLTLSFVFKRLTAVVLDEDPEDLTQSSVFRRLTVGDGNYRDFKTIQRYREYAMALRSMPVVGPCLDTNIPE
ncbi:hypothetical protein SK128_003233, partial [Halocaridina rubra]